MNAPTPPPSDAEQAAELRRLFAETTTKLGTVCAALGIPADQPLPVLQQLVRLHVDKHAKLLGAANEVLVSSQASLGEVWVRPPAMDRLREAVAFTQEM